MAQRCGAASRAALEFVMVAKAVRGLLPGRARLFVGVRRGAEVSPQLGLSAAFLFRMAARRSTAGAAAGRRRWACTGLRGGDAAGRGRGTAAGPMIALHTDGELVDSSGRRIKPSNYGDTDSSSSMMVDGMADSSR